MRLKRETMTITTAVNRVFNYPECYSSEEALAHDRDRSLNDILFELAVSGCFESLDDQIDVIYDDRKICQILKDNVIIYCNVHEPKG